MSVAVINSRAQSGIAAPMVSVEAHLSNGVPAFSIVGLPESVVRESRDRVRGALLNSHFEFPARRIIVNLAPADLPKEGGRFDLPIALGILAASGQLDQQLLQQYEFAGELALTGELRAIKGSLPFALGTRSSGRSLIVPRANAKEAALAQEVTIYAADHLLEVCAHLNQRLALLPVQQQDALSTPSSALHGDMCDVRGQAHARRALEIAAAGGHSLLFMGPPGTGKTMLASRLPSILPPMTEDEALEVAAIASISQQGFDYKLWRQRPFRAPHHTASGIALVGGGSTPKPGEISLAHHGVLFLDELPEFNRRTLEMLREPLESRKITISRATKQAEFPASFQLVAAMNPCPCGHLSDPRHACRCTLEQIQRYRARISGPLLDRIDMHVEVPALSSGFLMRDDQQARPESSAAIVARVEAARERQYQRAGMANHLLPSALIESTCPLTKVAQLFMESAMEKLGLSARAYHRVLKVARTIADIDNEADIRHEHLTEALAYRRLDRRQIPV